MWTPLGLLLCFGIERHPYFGGFWYISDRRGNQCILMLAHLEAQSCMLVRKANQRL